MKNQKKLIVIVTMIALLICAAMLSCAMADEKIYTSPTFKLPADKIMEWAENQPEEAIPEEEQPGDETADKGDTEDESGEETPAEETGENEVGTADTAGEPERIVTIRSSQGSVVTEGEIIYLTSKLKGFNGLDIAYQWQVDRGDGAGWVDVEGANRSKHMFVADKETITYSWRLIVSVMDDE